MELPLEWVDGVWKSLVAPFAPPPAAGGGERGRGDPREGERHAGRVEQSEDWGGGPQRREIEEDEDYEGPEPFWRRLIDEQGRPFYLNTETQAIVWRDPAEAQDAASRRSSAGSLRWAEATDPESGDLYYYHKDTEEVTWYTPDELLQRPKPGELQRPRALADGSSSATAAPPPMVPPPPPQPIQIADSKKKKKSPKKGLFSFLRGKADDSSSDEGELHDEALRNFKEGKHYVRFGLGEAGHGEDQDVDVYEGEFHKYKFHGKGKYTHKDGEEYEGDWCRGMQHGEGRKTWPNGDEYQGQYKEDRRCGQGTMKYADGTVFVGAWENNEWNGQGKVTWGKECKRAGSYSVAVFEDGTEKISRGVYYDGGFKDGLKYGHGEMVFDDGGVYKGDWLQDKYHGRGKFVFPNKDWYDGQWRVGTPDGLGKQYIAQTEEVYVGEFRQGVREGKGELKVKNGWAWKGDFLAGRRKGSGVHTSPEGRKLRGEWWQHADTRNQIPANIAETVVNTHALHEDNYMELFFKDEVPRWGGEEKRKVGFFSAFRKVSLQSQSARA